MNGMLSLKGVVATPQILLTMALISNKLTTRALETMLMEQMEPMEQTVQMEQTVLMEQMVLMEQTTQMLKK